jgi:hypothetical protein
MAIEKKGVANTVLPAKRNNKNICFLFYSVFIYEEDSPQQLSDKVRPAFQSALLLNLEYCVQTIRFTNQSYLYCTRKELNKKFCSCKKVIDKKNLFNPP